MGTKSGEVEGVMEMVERVESYKRMIRDLHAAMKSGDEERRTEVAQEIEDALMSLPDDKRELLLDLTEKDFKFEGMIETPNWKRRTLN